MCLFRDFGVSHFGTSGLLWWRVSTLDSSNSWYPKFGLMWLFQDFGVSHFTSSYREFLPWLLQLPISKTLKWSLCFWYPKWNLDSDLSMRSSLCYWSWSLPLMTNTHTLHSECTSALSLLVFMSLLCCIFPKYFWCPLDTLYLYSIHHHCCTCLQWQAYTACKTCQ